MPKKKPGFLNCGEGTRDYCNACEDEELWFKDYQDFKNKLMEGRGNKAAPAAAS